VSDGRSWIPENRFSILLVAILGLIILGPALQHLRGGHLLSLIAGFALPLAAIYSVSDSPRHMRVALVLFFPSAVANVVLQANDAPILRWMSLVFPFLFYGYATWVVGLAVFRSRRVTLDTLAGAACVYMLFGILFWKIYTAVTWIEPASFSANGSAIADSALYHVNLLYFSFITLTTLGSGEIAPTTVLARSLTIVEAVLGTLYMAIVIARLVGLYIVEARRESEG
jgi:hypothetical protein